MIPFVAILIWFQSQPTDLLELIYKHMYLRVCRIFSYYM